MKYLLENPIQSQIGTEKYQCKVTWRNGTFIADEPHKTGGKDLGPDPYSLLMASLASCTAVTLRMYIDKKGWDIDEIEVKTNLFKTEKEGSIVTVIDREIFFSPMVSEEQRIKLIEIAKACPISKILEGETKIRTYAWTDAETEKKIKYANDHVTVVWKPDLCKHSGRCVNGLPEAFNVNAHPWVNVSGAEADAIRKQVHKCPTGALSIEEPQTDTDIEV